MVDPLENYTRDVCRILAASLEMVAQGHPEFYRVAALELRLLLCDTTRRHNRMVDISLARQVWPGLRLQALNNRGEFDEALEPVALDDWLAQSIALTTGGSITLQELVRRVCDQDGGAHVDPKVRAGLQGVEDAPGWICKIGAEAQRALEKAGSVR